MKEFVGFVEKLELGETASHARSVLCLQLLGGFQLLNRGGETVVLPTRKADLLLAYLAMPAGRSHNRDKLAALFWSDRDDERARGSLRKALSALRAALGSAAIRSDRDSIALVPGWLEIDCESLAVDANKSAELSRIGPVDRRGEFLEGRSTGSGELGDWLTFERTRCRNLSQALLEKHAIMLHSIGRTGEALALAQRLLAIDNLREESHRLIMRLSAESGERSQALTQFHACRTLLRDELDVEPSGETLRLAQNIMGDGTDSTRLQAPGPAGSGAPRPDVRGLSIAVLPFQALGAMDGPEFFADGLTEDLVTELSRQRDITVIAHSSTRSFTGLGSVETAAQELGVRYVLTGTMRRAFDRLRINVQLIDSAGYRCIWAERYDNPVNDLFDVQDKVVSEIIARIDAEVRSEERERAARKRPGSLDAWELFHRGMWHAYRFTREDMKQARQWLEQAIALAPEFSLPYAGIAYVGFTSVTWHFVDSVEETLGEALLFARQALERDDRNAFAHMVFGRILTLSGDTSLALRHLERAVELNPGFSQAYFGFAWTLYWSGRPSEALENVGIAIRLNPRDPMVSFFLTLQACCYYWLGRYPKAEASARRAVQSNDREAWSRLALATVLVAQDRLEEAKQVIGEALEIDANLSLASFAALVGQAPAEVREPMFAALVRAGLR